MSDRRTSDRKRSAAARALTLQRKTERDAKYSHVDRRRMAASEVAR